MHIQSRADSDVVNGMMVMVMIAMMIVLVMVNIVQVALNQVNLVHEHSCKTCQQLIDFHQPNTSRGKLNSSQCLHLSAAAPKHCAVMQSLSRL
jgi:hypothetical protein